MRVKINSEKWKGNYMDTKQRKSTFACHVGLWLILFYICGLFMQNKSDFNFLMFLENLNLKPKNVFDGEITRLFTWILVPSSTHGMNQFLLVVKMILITFASLLLGHMFGRAKYYIFILRGMLLTLLGAFIAYGSAFVWSDKQGAWDLSSMFIPSEFSTIYVLMSQTLLLGIILVRKTLRYYKPNFIVGIVCLVTFFSYMIYEMVLAYSFSRDGFVVMCVVLGLSVINVVLSLIHVNHKGEQGEVLRAKGLLDLNFHKGKKSA